MYKKAILKYVHQAFYQAGPAQITELFSVKAIKYDSRRSKQLVLDRPKKEIGRLSLRHRGTMIWNSIPSSVKEYDNVILFKNRLKQLFKFINNFTFEKESSLITNKSLLLLLTLISIILLLLVYCTYLVFLLYYL